MLHHPHADRTRLRASRPGSVRLALACSMPVRLGAQVPMRPHTRGRAPLPPDGRVAPSTGRIEGAAVFEAPDVPRFLELDRWSTHRVISSVLRQAAAAGEPPVERVGEDVHGPRALDDRSRPKALPPSIELRWSGSCATTFAPVKRRGVSTTPGCARTSGRRASISHPTQPGIRSSTRTIPGLEWTPCDALQLDARRHLAGAAGGERRPGPSRRTRRHTAAGAGARRFRKPRSPSPAARCPRSSGTTARYSSARPPPDSRSRAAAARRGGGYLDLYQPLLGAYPFRESTVVENFFSSGFAFPGFTPLSSQFARWRARPSTRLPRPSCSTTGGDGAPASRRSGHWAEALATDCANYMRPVLKAARAGTRAAPSVARR